MGSSGSLLRRLVRASPPSRRDEWSSKARCRLASEKNRPCGPRRSWSAPLRAISLVIICRRSPLFLLAGHEVRLPSRRRALLAWGSGDCLDLFFLRLLLLPIASLFASGHVSLLWMTTSYHLCATMGCLLLGAQSVFNPEQSSRRPGLRRAL
jgi:hypothetical protein